MVVVVCTEVLFLAFAWWDQGKPWQALFQVKWTVDCNYRMGIPCSKQVCWPLGIDSQYKMYRKWMLIV